MEYILIFIVIGAILFWGFSNLEKQQESIYSPYTLNTSLLTPAERSFYGVLVQAVEPEMVVCPKVRIADVLKVPPSPDRSTSQTRFNRIAMKHFDYVVCDKENFSFQYIVELNDSSHLNQSRAKRDKFISEICKSAQIPLIQFKVQSGYSLQAVRGIIRTEIEEQREEHFPETDWKFE